jgi:molecular chaperone GrpE
MAEEHEYTKREPRFDGAPGESPDAGAHAEAHEAEGAHPAGTEPGAHPGDPASLGQQLQEAERKAQEHHEAWLRARADMENLRKRSQIDVANAHKYAVENLASELLPVRDALEAALATENNTQESLRSGVELTLKQLTSVFDKAHLKEINPVGEKFDPHRHQAISMLPSDREPNTVINVLQKGYLLSDRVIRPALVTVAKGKD